MTKLKLIEQVAVQTRMTQAEVTTLIETIFARMADALAQGDKVELRGFGSLRIRRRLPRSGRNPKTRSRVDVPAKRVLRFRVGKEIRQLLKDLAR